jgi:hypothetical protein
MADQLTLIEQHPLTLLPSAKVKSGDRTGVHGWTNFYAAFSDAFAGSAISALDVQPRQIVLDPCVGSGTTLVAALKAGVAAIGVDLDPFSCLLSRAKIATNVDAGVVSELLESSRFGTSFRPFSADAQKLFDGECLEYAASVFNKLRSRIHSSDGVLDILLADAEGRYDSEAVALAALCIGASESANVVKGSNPTWYRRAIEGEKDTFEALYSATKSVSQQMVNDLMHLRSEVGKRDILIFNQNIKELGSRVSRSTIDVVLTSPPYLTRLDYVIKHLPNLLILTGLLEIDVESLRRQMIGTTKMVEKGVPDPKWGSECNKTLAEIRAHHSYASERYYFWHYFQYFKSLYKSLEIMISRLRKRGKGVIVLQDSFYKDIEIRLDIIAIDMLSSMSVAARSVRRDEVKNNMKQLNPAHQKVGANKKSNEHSIFFEKIS